MPRGAMVTRATEPQDFLKSVAPTGWVFWLRVWLWVSPLLGFKPFRHRANLYLHNGNSARVVESEIAMQPVLNFFFAAVGPFI